MLTHSKSTKIMATLINLSIDVEKLPKQKFVKGKKGTYYNFTIAVNDETRYGNNVSAYDSQTKEEREAKKNRDFIGNGKVVWTDGNIVVAEREEQVAQPQTTVEVESDGDLPF